MLVCEHSCPCDDEYCIEEDPGVENYMEFSAGKVVYPNAGGLTVSDQRRHECAGRRRGAAPDAVTLGLPLFSYFPVMKADRGGIQYRHEGEPAL